MRYAMLCILVLCLSSVLCVEGKADVLAAKYDNEIKIAIDALESHWRKLYKEVSDLDSGEASPDGYFEIKNTRIVVLKNNSSEKLGRPCMRYQVEFVIATDYFCASPYYFVLPLDNIVVILDDGKVEVVQKKRIV